MLATQQRPEQEQQQISSARQQGPASAAQGGQNLDNSFAVEQAGLAQEGMGSLAGFGDMIGEALLEADKAQIPSRDIVYEQLAHRLAYQGETKMGGEPLTLDKLGYQEVDRFSDPVTSLEFVAFAPSESSFLRQQRLPQPAVGVVAFRGTQEGEDYLQDMNPAGIGYEQFEANQDRIRQAMTALGSFDVTGHSLGGALAQLAACRIGGVREIVTFQAPGINEADVALLEEGVKSTHYRRKGDLVDNAGEAHTEGEVIEFGASTEQMDGPLGHLDFLLAGIGQERGLDVEGNGFEVGSIEQGTTAEMDDQRYEDVRRGTGEVIERVEELREALSRALEDNVVDVLEQLHLQHVVAALGIDVAQLAIDLSIDVFDKLVQLAATPEELERQLEAIGEEDVKAAVREAVAGLRGLSPYADAIAAALSPAVYAAWQAFAQEETTTDAAA
jgi:hypothetical protein